MNAIFFFVGYRRVRVSAAYASALLNACLQYGIVYSDFEASEAGDISFCLSLFAAKRLERICATRGIELKKESGRGLPSFLWRYRKRAGMAVGGVLAVVLLVLSGRFVWDVRVSGNDSMTAGEVIAELDACGFGVGSYIPTLKTEELETNILIASNRISWISIYMDGTVAKVQIIEHRNEDKQEENLTRPANLIASCDGQIEYVELYRGSCVVKVGQAVRAGELLVSGVYDSATEGFRYTRAAGAVMARTEKTFTVRIPLSYEKKVYGEPYCSSVVMNFFDFSVKIFKNSGNDGGACDIIKEKKSPALFGVADLPLSFDVVTQKPYTLQTTSRTHAEALELAYGELELYLSALSKDAQLLRKDVATEITEDALTLTCTLSCIENIAVQSEFDVTE